MNFFNNLNIFLAGFFLIIQSTFLTGQTVDFNIGSVTGSPGETVCLDVTVSNFTGINSVQWVLRFDPKVLSMQCPIDPSNSALNVEVPNTLIAGNFNCTNADKGYMNFVWFGPEVTLADGSILFTVCFDIIGDPCDFSDVTISGSGQVPIEVIQGDTEIGIHVNPGKVEVDIDGFFVSQSYCSSEAGVNNGVITFAGGGGAGPYQWFLHPTSETGTGLQDCETMTITGLAPGTYQLEFIDATGTTILENIVIDMGEPFTVSLTPQHPSCFDRANGKVIVDTIIGGLPPYTFEWSTFEFLDNEISKLGTGDYSVTVTDANGCTTTASTTLVADTVKVMLDIISQPTCDGSTNGVVSFTATGGTPFPDGYKFDIDGVDNTYFSFGGPANPFVVGNFPSGTFSVVATDNAVPGCASDPVIFTLVDGAFGELTMTSQDETCFGACDGSIFIDLVGDGNFSFMVSGSSGTVLGTITTNTFEALDLCPDNYNVQINDVINGCTLDTSFVISGPEELVLTVIDSIGPGCGGGDGMVSLGATGGMMPYDFMWSDGFDQPVRNNMGGGNYTVTVTDQNQCTAEISFYFAPGGDIGLNAFVSQAISCGGQDNGAVSATVTAQGDFTFSWTDKDGNSVGTGPIITGLSGGYYYVQATDGTCTDVDTVFLVDGQEPSVTANITTPTCFDASDGMIVTMPQDGVLPFQYEWTEPPSNSILSTGAVLLGAVGTYHLHIIDDNGCESDTTFMIPLPDNILTPVINDVTGVSCFGVCDGALTVQSTGGDDSGMRTFYVSNLDDPANPFVLSGTPSVTFNSLCAGQNWVIVGDGICSSDTMFFEVPDIAQIQVGPDSEINNPLCSGDQNGSISLDLIGGNLSTVDVVWIGQNQTGLNITGLGAGVYYMTITDANGCMITDSIELVDPSPVVLQLDSTITLDVNCFSPNSGQIGVFTYGGQGEYTYNWSPLVSAGDVALNLTSGLYEITVTDSNGCTDSIAHTLVEPIPVKATFPADLTVECFGERTCVGPLTASGGVGGPFNFSVNNGVLYPLDTCIELFSGTYSFSVFDQAGCPFDTTIYIDQPQEILVDAGEDITIDLGSETDPISVFIVSESDIDSIFWTPMADLECNTADCQVVTFSPSITTEYLVTAVDSNGCQGQDDIIVTVDKRRNVYFPNIFSPNGDNRNDFFQLATGSGVVEVNEMKIYDRWGNLLYHDESYMPDDSVHRGWDGTSNGRQMQPGVYVYFAEVSFVDGAIIRYRGDVTIFR